MRFVRAVQQFVYKSQQVWTGLRGVFVLGATATFRRNAHLQTPRFAFVKLPDLSPAIEPNLVYSWPVCRRWEQKKT